MKWIVEGKRNVLGIYSDGDGLNQSGKSGREKKQMDGGSAVWRDTTLTANTDKLLEHAMSCSKHSTSLNPK